MFKYKVNFWDKVNQEPATDNGLVNGKNYDEAIHEITEFYGEDNIINIFLEVFGNVLPEEEIIEIMESGE